MLRTSLFAAACTTVLLASGALITPSSAATSPFMQACSGQWQAMKQAGTVPAGEKWSDFLKTCNGGQAQNAAPATAAPAVQAVSAPAAVKAPKVATPIAAVKVPDAATPAVASSGQSFMQVCSGQWKAMKQAGTVPAGEKWTDFLKTCSAGGSAPLAAAQPAPAKIMRVAAAKAAPQPVVAAAPAAIAPAIVAPAATPSGGQVAQLSRIKQCGTEWKADKATNTIPAGQTWPQFWSACDARLKG